MATTSEANSTPTPEYVPAAGPKTESAPSEKTRSLGRPVVEPKDPPAVPTNAAITVGIKPLPEAVLPQGEVIPVATDSTSDAPAKQGGDCKSTGKALMCPVCGRRYQTLDWLQQHIVTHKRGKPLKCRRCRRSYMMRHALARHMADVHGV
ncbi:uncharacterized protein LOC142784430 [Rhipicephalus microplus]|uniref:uncharacterized protein LOC142784430 n=1 Tax=Rhipicephalus microplus TaxID=6941 RepID=UPI003F6AD605